MSRMAWLNIAGAMLVIVSVAPAIGAIAMAIKLVKEGRLP